MITSANGTGTVDGLTEGLSNKADMMVFQVLRELADVILAGAGTVRLEGYRGARSSEQARQRRLERGQAAVPPIAVVTASADLDPESALFTDTHVPPIIFTTSHAPKGRVAALTDAGAKVFVVGRERVEIPLLLDTLTDAGLTRVLCEGGPNVFGNLVQSDAVDELFLTISPCLVGNGDFIYSGAPAPLQHMRLLSTLVDDGTLFLRYERDRSGRAHAIGRPAIMD
jgi:riboflavin biosynthesis pyrimidine reductase